MQKNNNFFIVFKVNLILPYYIHSYSLDSYNISTHYCIDVGVVEILVLLRNHKMPY